KLRALWFFNESFRSERRCDFDVSILPDGFDMARCTQNFKLSNSTLLIQFNDSTDFDELTKPVSSLPEEGLRFCNQTELVLRYFRKDGHNWRKKKDGKTAKEAHEKLKVGSIDVLNCYYANGEDNENFQGVKGNRISSSGIKENNSISLSGSTSVNIDSTANTSSTLSPLCEDDDSGNRDGWIHGNKVKENDSQRLMGVPALDASFENPLARYQNLPYNLVLTQTNLSNVGLIVKENDSQRLMGVPALDASFENLLARYQNLPYNLMLTQTNLSNAGLMKGISEILFKTKEIDRFQFRTACHCKNGSWTPIVLTWPYMRISGRFRVLSAVKTSSSLLGAVFKLRFQGPGPPDSYSFPIFNCRLIYAPLVNKAPFS
ncbi:LOW QUALITY PROTEIN: hypothetical protein HID58_067842, partial [Brassica napus]